MVHRWLFVAIALTLLFLIDLIGNLTVYPFREVLSTKKVLILEMILQAGSVIAICDELFANFLNYTDGIIIFQAVFFLRNFHAVRLLVELREFKVIVRTSKNLAIPFFSMIVSIYTVFYFYAIVGEIWFGGKVRTDSA